MRFHPTDEQLQIQDALRGTLADTLPPAALHRLVDGDAELDVESWQALMALGVGGLMLPEAAGGAALSLVDAVLAVEVLGAGAVSGPVVPHLMAGLAVAASADPALRERWLPGLASGETIATIAFGGAWVPESWDVAIADGRVTGAVQFVQAAGAAALFLVGVAGGGLALVEPGEGVRIEPLASEDRSRRLSRVVFDGAPATPLAIDSGRVFDAGLVLIAADALGGAQRATDMTVAYAKDREQFGQPIGRFQALKHQLATMALEVEPARALVWYAAYAWDRALPDAQRSAAIAKAHLADRFTSVARAAVAAHGGIGYTWEYDLSIWVRRAFFDRAFLGGPSVHRARAVALAGW
ncbi:acyl-CoA dehydrogenase family protein [Sphingomonas bacterium]|uniref:acyl-CoA dehydrogenase family protein n=1 Tax=Sphingomonas bacterium TaxID=1895847 RepID=UPI0020C62F67|nr:acyl-CoA dehydrogenase family protein [Sphingomonas bacterium]